MPVVTTAEYVVTAQIYARSPTTHWPYPDTCPRPRGPDLAGPAAAARGILMLAMFSRRKGDHSAGEGFPDQAQGRHARRGRGDRPRVRPEGPRRRGGHAVLPGVPRPRQAGLPAVRR